MSRGRQASSSSYELTGGDLLSNGLVRRPTGDTAWVKDDRLFDLVRHASAALSASELEALAVATAIVLGRYSTSDTVSIGFEGAHSEKLVWDARCDKGTTVGEMVAAVSDAAVSDDLPLIRVVEARPDRGLAVGMDEDALWVAFDPGLITEHSVRRMVGHLQIILERLGRDPAGSPASWDLLTAEELSLLATWNQTAVDYDLDRDFVTRFEAQAALTPEVIAAEEPGRTITYHELNATAEGFAHHLAERGVTSEAVVGLMVHRGIDALAAIIGIFKAGAAYFPIDHTGPAARSGLAIAQGAPDICAVHRDLIQKFDDVRGAARRTYETLIVDEALKPSGTMPLSSRDPNGLAYVLSTSGSTGIPKATMIEQRGMLNHSLAMIDVLDLDSDDIVAQSAPLTFDISVWQLVTPLLVGARVSFVDEESLRAPDRLLQWAEERRITILQTVPSIMSSILQLSGYDETLGLPPTLRWLIPTGEALPVATARRWLDQFPTPPLLNAYGPAECADDVTVQRIDSVPPADLVSMPIGTPLPNVAVYVLDRHGHRAPVGAVGEICVGGVGVGRGYRNDPERTTTAFCSNPFPPFGRLYRTGDLGRFLEDGSLQFVGRVDHQVKVGGIRIELGELETALADHPDVDQAVAVARDSQLIAYVTPGEGRSIDRDRLIAHLTERLPHNMVPRGFVELPTFPLNPNGKIDRQRLPVPTANDLGVTAASKGNATETEKHLARIWEELLKTPVGLDDDFFALGGTSLLAAVMLWRVRRELEADLPISTPARASTVRQLSALIDGASEMEDCLVPLRTGGTRTPLFLAPGQGGSTLGFVQLARHLDPDRPVWGLDLQRRREDPAEPQSFESLVDRYLAAMRSAQPQGPYIVGGWCLGGEVAYEIAKRLEREGEKAALVVLLQTDNVSYPRYQPGVGPARRLWYAVLDRIEYERAMMTTLPSRQRLGYLRREIVGRTLVRLRLPLEGLVVRLAPRLGWSFHGSEQFHQRRWHQADGAVYDGHSFEPHDGDVLQIRARHQPRGIVPDPTLGWGDLVKEKLDTVEVDGWHWNFLREPAVHQVARELSLRLDQIDGSGPAG